MKELIGKKAYVIVQGKRYEGTITEVFKEKGIWMVRLGNDPFHTYYSLIR